MNNETEINEKVIKKPFINRVVEKVTSKKNWKKIGRWSLDFCTYAATAALACAIGYGIGRRGYLENEELDWDPDAADLVIDGESISKTTEEV